MLQKTDPAVSKLIAAEKKRQEQGIELIASENFASQGVLEATGSILTNKYSEGYAGKRYYAGNEIIDEIENLAISRAKKLFGAEHVNVQPLSGTPANMAVYIALLEFGDKAMGMSLSHGGHLSHGHKVSFTGKAYCWAHYTVDAKTEMLDYDAIEKLARAEKPKIIVSGYTAYSRTIDFKRFAEISQSVDAYAMADIAHIAGLVAAGVHPSPVPHMDVVTTTTHKTLRGPRGAMIMCRQEHAEKIDRAVFPGIQGGPHDHTTAGIAVAFGEALKPEFKNYAKQIIKNAQAMANEFIAQGVRVVSGGTDNHLMLLDVSDKKASAKEITAQMDRAGIIANMNTIPFDKGTPFNPSGIRLGTPLATTRGMKESEMKQIAQWISAIIEKPDDNALAARTKKEVQELCRKFVFYR
ncbi:MAG: serine hydroxymethyltransferase [Candidatus Diapherotrites archaeon]|nr:serine hydroxymethyltransferase [Candidatus Micrarchaeota archaeon]MBU1940022.1 serine hydroxymethyltransferase [Candidatus Micrarchaeota archaeon]